jgi:hypothetical protein
VAGALFTLSFIYATLGLTIWTGRALRFGLFTGGFKLPVQATQNDILTLDPMRRGWRLVVIENQTLIAWTAVGILGMAAAQLYYSGVNGGYPPDTILRFLISPWINPQYIPLG